jgi:hypothetical protein
MMNVFHTKASFMSLRRQTTLLRFHLLLFAIGALAGSAIIVATRKTGPPSETRIVAIQLRYNFVTVTPEFDAFEELIDKFREDGGIFLASIPGARVLNRSDLGMQHFEDDSVTFEQPLEEFATLSIKFHYFLPGNPDRGALTIEEGGRSSTHVLRFCEGELRMIPIDLGRNLKHERCYLFIHSQFARQETKN